MSNIYIQEPPTNGKVLIKTSAGDIDVELWSKEAPKACRNFIQLCMEGYYNGTIFHRVVPEFIIQGGDPTGTGTGGESVYGRPFKDEFHSRLRFNRRGLVAMANAGAHDNGSQFFFTLGRADELNNKHTIFGKVTGDTVYNMLRLAEVECDGNERPLKPHKIRSTEVLHSPFDDIILREIRVKKEKHKEEEKKSQSKATKNFSLLSFGEEAEEEEEMVTQVSQTLKGKSKSSHDLLKDDPKLSCVPVVDSKSGSDVSEGADKGQDDEDEDEDEKMRQKEMRARISNKLKKEKVDEEKSEVREEVEKKSSRSEELRKEARQLKRELLAIKQRKDERMKPEEEKNSSDRWGSAEAGTHLHWDTSALGHICFSPTSAPSQPHLSPTSAPPQPHLSPTSAPPQPHLSPTSAPPQPHLSPTSAPSQPHLSPTSAPPQPHLSPTSAPPQPHTWLQFESSEFYFILQFIIFGLFSHTVMCLKGRGLFDCQSESLQEI
ncbi:spliceosome-associated protein CWC27 homolog isoform X2 [Tachysurus fulvidraco]|uniref:spliceosome-associated protein CWC27 homolog isoform X2 n=1 Tax=Tachysurus fulvidraco TaxID=1234273 RepID=UPI001FEE93EE|nr:spliceosome-associated protein CWC27 homolog isoform X2 [Tachysurus fulvidraco]